MSSYQSKLYKCIRHTTYMNKRFKHFGLPGVIVLMPLISHADTGKIVSTIDAGNDSYMIRADADDLNFYDPNNTQGISNYLPQAFGDLLDFNTCNKLYVIADQNSDGLNQILSIGGFPQTGTGSIFMWSNYDSASQAANKNQAKVLEVRLGECPEIIQLASSILPNNQDTN